MRHEYLSVYNLKNKRINSEQITVDALSAGAISVGGGGLLTKEHTVKATGSFGIFKISGAVRVQLMQRCVQKISAAGAPLLLYGTSATTGAFIGGTTKTQLATSDTWWVSITGASNTARIRTARILDRLMHSDIIKFKQSAATAHTTAGGKLKFFCWWEPIEDGATVEVAS